MLELVCLASLATPVAKELTRLDDAAHGLDFFLSNDVHLFAASPILKITHEIDVIVVRHQMGANGERFVG